MNDGGILYNYQFKNDYERNELVLSRVSWQFQLEACKERTTQQPSCHSSGFHQFEAIDHFYVCPGNLYGWPENLVDLDPDRDYMILIFCLVSCFLNLIKMALCCWFRYSFEYSVGWAVFHNYFCYTVGSISLFLSPARLVFVFVHW